MMRLVDRLFAPILIFLLLSLAAAIGLGVLQHTEIDAQARGSVHSPQDEGASVLSAWLSERGYKVHSLAETPLSPSLTDQLLFVLAPSDAFKTTELLKLTTWVRAGGTLVLAQDKKSPSQLLAHLKIALVPLARPVERAALRLPALNWPPAGQIRMHAAYKLELRRNDTAVHVGDCDTPLLVSFGLGAGQVFVLPTLYPLTNRGLRETSNTRLVYNLVNASVAPGGAIAFDEAHHTKPSTTISLASLFAKPEGWGFLYAVIVLFGYLTLSGRPFVSPLPRHQQDVDSALPLSQTAPDISPMTTDLRALTGVHSVIQYTYWERLKADLSRVYHLDPTLADSAFLSHLSHHRKRDEIDIAALTDLYAGLGTEAANEADLVEWTKKVIEWRQDLSARDPT